MRIELPAYCQTRPYTCVAASLRCVLSALGTDVAEDDLAQACKTEPAGATLRDAALAARSIGFTSLYMASASFEHMSAWLKQGVPMIVGLAADELAEDATGGHAVVVCGIEEGEVLAIDPAIGAERRIDVDRFLRAWRRRGNRGLVVTK